MPKLPVVSARELVRAFQRLGYKVDRQRGSHIVMKSEQSPTRTVVIPNDAEIAKGTLRQITRDAGMTVERLISVLRG